MPGILNPGFGGILSGGDPMLNLGLSMMAQGPSLSPMSNASAFGRAGLMAQQQQREAERDQLNRFLLMMQIQQMQNKNKLAQQQQDMVNNILNSLGGDGQQQQGQPQGLKVTGAAPTEEQAIAAVRAASQSGLPATIGYGPNPLQPKAQPSGAGGLDSRALLALSAMGGGPADLAKLAFQMQQEQNKYGRLTPFEVARINNMNRNTNLAEASGLYEFNYRPPNQVGGAVPQQVGGSSTQPTSTQPTARMPYGQAPEGISQARWDMLPQKERNAIIAERDKINTQQKANELNIGAKIDIEGADKELKSLPKLTDQIKQFADRLALITDESGNLLKEDNQVYAGIFGGVRQFGARIKQDMIDSVFGGKLPGWLPNFDPNSNDKLANTKLLEALMGREVFESIRELGVGARGIDTPAEREFLRDVLSGRLQWTPESLKKFFEYRQKYLKMAAEEFKDKIKAGDYERWERTVGSKARLQRIADSLDAAVNYKPSNIKYGGPTAPPPSGNVYQSLPPANKHKGKAAYDDERDQWYESDGMRWVPIDKPKGR